MSAVVVFSKARPATSEDALARAPDATPTQGPSHGRENAGGNRIESREAITTTPPRVARTRSHLEPRMRDRPLAIDRTSPTIAANAATKDQRPDRVQAPNASDPGPKRLQGNAVARTANPNATCVRVLIVREGRTLSVPSSVGAPEPSTRARHSPP